MENYPNFTTPQQVQLEQAAFITRVYYWMAAALGLTGLTSMFVVSSENLLYAIASNQILFYGLIIGEIGLVMFLTSRVHKMTAQNAMIMFLTYSILNGITLSVIFLIYTAESIASTFFITAGTFAGMSAYGYYSKKDLTKIGNIVLMAICGLILASIVNIFLNSSALYWISTFAGVIIFTALTAYDTQKIKNLSMYGAQATDEGKKLAIMGALTLYLDFINLFLHLLRIFGRRR
ncbi:MAG: Bax inhibitor-1/YccA family protein [Cytophagaceae bacterium]|nr:Bax inhibitor-1/YccA family protein [Cytophagaceae bacterium]MDW8455654.1 Bax inhibitor-1/YccA family protein [Cytophagaceae bacterium]